MWPTASSRRLDCAPQRGVGTQAWQGLLALIVTAALAAGCSTLGSTSAKPNPPSSPGATKKALPCEAPTGVTNFLLRGGGAVHPVRIFVPSVATESASGSLPVVIDWPALGLTGAQQAAVTGYESLAQAQGFVVVHPTGAPSASTHQDSWQLVKTYDPERDDVAFADTLINTLIAHWCVDPRRVYSTGYSNGALFTARLVCDLAQRLAAAVMVAGVYHPAGCTPARAVPMVAYHGTADRTIPFNGGGRSLLAGSGWPGIRDFFYNVIPDEFAKFAKDFKCDRQPRVTRIGTDVIRQDYLGCENGVPLSFFEVVGGGHTWPGSPLASILMPFGRTTETVNATVDGWSFMKTKSLATK